MNFRALRDPNQRAGHLRRLTFFSQGVHFHAGTVVRFRIPIPRRKFQMKGQDSALQLTRRNAVIVGTNRDGSRRGCRFQSRTRLGNSSKNEDREQDSKDAKK